MENSNVSEILTKEQKAALKAQRKAEFEEKFKKEKIDSKLQDANKSKAQLKAERRSKQDAQRAAKSQNIQGHTQCQASATIQTVPAVSSAMKENTQFQITKPLKEKLDETSKTFPKVIKQLVADAKREEIIANKDLSGKIFAPLPRRILNLSDLSTSSIPPLIVQVGYRINKDLIKGSSNKCIAMLMAFKNVIEEYEYSSKNDLKRELQKLLFNDCLKFLGECRPLSISMSNAVKYLKLVFSRIPSEADNDKVKQMITSAIDIFFEEEILCSWKAIVDRSLEKILENDVILTLGCSTMMKHVLYNASKNEKKIRVIVVDTRPKFDGKEMLQFLVENGIPATYILINSISYVMKEVTKVIIEANSLLGNGYVMSPIGFSQIALVAKAYNVPVIVCCETYKFSERVHTDCFVHNELGDDSSNFFNSVHKKNSIDLSDCPKLSVFDLLYDLTPHEFVSVVITEKGMLPCTSVSAILRVRETK